MPLPQVVLKPRHFILCLFCFFLSFKTFGGFGNLRKTLSCPSLNGGIGGLKETIKGIAIKLEISSFSFPITYFPFPIPHFTVTSATYSHEAIVLVAAAVKTLICLIKPGAHY